ncbi:hypothetical protein HMPREF2747_05565 [Fusobacterium sp. HMSC073F01]|nr:hypothetical protein HMPREF2747_05565 [Fusobacterium sp. HMSC073F01]
METKKEVLEELKSNLDGLQAIKLAEKVQGGPIKDDSGIVNKMNKIIEMEKDLNELCNFQIKLSQTIDKMENTNERAVLRLRYILNQTWEEIAEKMGYTLRQIHRIHGNAIKNF